MFWLDLAKTLMPILAPLLVGGPIFAFLLRLLARHDALAKRKRNDQAAYSKRTRIYERAFWLAQAEVKDLVQVVGPAILAFKRGEHLAAGQMLEIISHRICDRSGPEMALRELPDFLDMARKEIEMLDGSNPLDENWAANLPPVGGANNGG